MVIIEVLSHWISSPQRLPRPAWPACSARWRRVPGLRRRTRCSRLAAAVTVAAAIIGVRLAAAVVGNACAHARACSRLCGWSGHRTGEADVVMVAATKPAAYCVAGRPPAIVVTSAARAALEDRQLAAVLAHQRAHLDGAPRDDRQARCAALAAMFPQISLITEGAQQVSAICWRCARMTSAARRHSRRALLSGLITLCTAAPAGSARGPPMLAVLARAERLARPPQESTKVKTRVALTSVIAIMAAGPSIAVADCFWRSMCGVPGCMQTPTQMQQA